MSLSGLASRNVIVTRSCMCRSNACVVIVGSIPTPYFSRLVCASAAARIAGCLVRRVECGPGFRTGSLDAPTNTWSLHYTPNKTCINASQARKRYASSKITRLNNKSRLTGHRQSSTSNTCTFTGLEICARINQTNNRVWQGTRQVLGGSVME